MNSLDDIVSAAQAEFGAAPTPAELENAKARFLGKSGRVTELLKALASLSPEEKKARGAAINQAKSAIEAALQARPAPDHGTAPAHEWRLRPAERCPRPGRHALLPGVE